jgi:hypothetical protein
MPGLSMSARRLACLWLSTLLLLLVAIEFAFAEQASAQSLRDMSLPQVDSTPAEPGWAALHLREALRGRRCDRDFRCRDWPRAADHAPLLERYVAEQRVASAASAHLAARLRSDTHSPDILARDYAALLALVAADERRWHELQAAYHRQWLALNEGPPALPDTARLGVITGCGLLLALAVGGLRRSTRRSVG